MLSYLGIQFCAGGTLLMGRGRLHLMEQKVTVCMLLTQPYQGFSAQVPLFMENLTSILPKVSSIDLL
jgi:hypothetical protein